jgi:FkbH-like protein
MLERVNSPSDYISAERKIKKSNDLIDINIAFLSSYTSEILSPYIKVELAKQGYFSSLYFAPYKQIDQEVFNITSQLYLSKPDFIIIHNRIEDMYDNLMFRFTGYSQEELSEILNLIIRRFDLILRKLRENTDAKIIVMNFANTQESISDFICSPALNAKSDFIYSLNKKLLLLCQRVPSCFLINYLQLLSNIGLRQWTDEKLNYLARIPFASNVQIEIGRNISRVVFAIFNPPKKCLVLDLDNTLWGGVIGEDGISGIHLGEDYPGNVFRDFQRVVLSLRDQGVLLAIASKNNVNDALMVFEKHSGCILSKEDFSAIEINWNDKAKSLESISNDLNIGLESMVFFDDNPVERQWVKDNLPEVSVIDVPKSPIKYIDSLVGSGHFDSFLITSEDSNRSNLYNQEKKRKESYSRSDTVEDFLTDLQMKVTVGPVDELSIARFEQLLNKTNQFNLTTRRYSYAEIKEIIDSGGLAFWLGLRDKFGDSGISGAFILKKINNIEWEIDTFLLSCRIIGRKVETAFLSVLVDVVKVRNGEILYGEYVPTTKNSLVSGFYKKHGFDNNIKNRKNYWKLNLNKIKVKSPNFITIIKEIDDRY